MGYGGRETPPARWGQFIQLRKWRECSADFRGRGKRQLAHVSIYYLVGCTEDNKEYTYWLTNGQALANALQECVICIFKKNCPDKADAPRTLSTQLPSRYKIWVSQHLSPQIIIVFFWLIPEIPHLALPSLAVLIFILPGTRPAWAGLRVQVGWETIHCSGE